MKSTSALYKTIFADPAHEVEHKVTIAGVTYGMDKLISISTPSQIFDGGPGIGMAISRELELEFIPEGTIPTAAAVSVFTRLLLGAQASEWLNMGNFYIDSRTYDETGDVLSLHCYDEMLKTEFVYLDKHNDQDKASSWPQSVRTLYQTIADDIGVSIDITLMRSINAMWSIPYPGNNTARTILCQMAAALGGNWVITDGGVLTCKKLTTSATVAQDLGMNVGALSRGIDSAAFTCVKLTGITGVEGVTEYVAGNTTGLTVEAECPWATQSMANLVLSTINGWVYRPYTADEALLDPAIELGDTVRINGWTSVVAKMQRNFDKLCDASISAPDDEELNHEFPYVYSGRGSNHELKVIKEEVAQVSNDVSKVSNDLNKFKNSVASLSSYRTVKLNFSGWSGGAFTETLENSDDPTVTYQVTKDGSGRPTKLTCSDGHTMNITW